MAAPIPAALAPTEFDSNLSTWITNQHTESIFSIMLEPIEGKIRRIKALADKVRTVPKKGGDRRDRVKTGSYSTGFVIAQDPDCLRLLTCAHGLDHVFKRTEPISAARANKLFRTTVRCDHQEHQYRQGDMVAPRNYCRATIVAINCGHDLMVVDVQRAHLIDNGVLCDGSHRSVRLGTAVLEERINKCLFLSWTPDKHRKRTEGQTSTMRRITEISRPNRSEYNMNVLEVMMGTEDGTSGGPLFNGAGEVIGLLHCGGIEDGAHCSYFVTLQHLIDFVALYVE